MKNDPLDITFCSEFRKAETVMHYCSYHDLIPQFRDILSPLFFLNAFANSFHRISI